MSAPAIPATDWAHRPALGTTCWTDWDDRRRAVRCGGGCNLPLVLTDRRWPDGSPVWEPLVDYTDPRVLAELQDNLDPGEEWHVPDSDEHGDAWCSACGERLLLPGFAGGPEA